MHPVQGPGRQHVVAPTRKQLQLQIPDPGVVAILPWNILNAWIENALEPRSLSRSICRENQIVPNFSRRPETRLLVELSVQPKDRLEDVSVFHLNSLSKSRTEANAPGNDTPEHQDRDAAYWSSHSAFSVLR